MDLNGEVVTFFSFKGGTGRTMALANVAWILASRGKRVLVVDWDLDSPGLHKFFHPFLDADLYDSTAGIVDIIADFSRAATHSQERPEDWHLRYARVLPHAVSLDWSFPDGGTLDIISAGRRGRSYSAVLSGFHWDNFYYRLGGGLLFSAMREDMKRNYDYTLIDSRTGLSDMAGICTVRFPDTVVNCFTFSGQSIEGAAGVARTIDDLAEDREIRMLPVPMRVEDGEQAKLEHGRALARLRFAGYPSGLDREARQRYWGDVEIPYKTFYAYEEILATFGDEPRMPLTLLSSYERLASVITRGAVRELAPIPDDVRRRFAAAYERRSAVVPPDVFLSYAPEDRIWADWIASVLQRYGVHVVAQGADFPAGSDVVAQVGQAIEAAGFTMVLLSPSYVRSSQARVVWEVLAGAEAEGSRRPLVPVRVAEVRLGAPFDVWNAVDLVRLDEEAAQEAVLRALELSTALVRHPTGEPHPVGQAHPAGQPHPAGDPHLAGDLQAVRFPGARPPVWSVPARNASFTGRSALLQRLRDNLSIGSTVVKPQAAYGLGGVGKTQLVIEYAHRFMADYDLVYWVSAQQEELIAASLAEIAPALGIRRGDNIDAAAEAVRDALRRGQPYSRWLLIFDNAEDPDVLAPHLPQGNGHVIITSRNPSWAHLATPVEVAAFSRQESVEHLTRRVPALSEQDAGQVAQILGDLPLAVELASAWLETTGMPVDQYVALLENQLADWLSSSQPSDYPLTAAATWRVSIERLRQERPSAVRLLELCSCFGPEPIAMSLLYSDETLNSLLPYDSRLTEKMLLGRVIRDVGRYALARVDQGRSSIQVHRLVQAVIRDSLTPERAEETRHEVHRILASGRPRQGDIDDPENWPRYNQIWPHLAPSNARACTEGLVRGLLVERVRYLWLRGEYDDGLALADSLVDLWTHEQGEDDRQLLYLRFHIANIVRSQGDYAASLRIDQDVLQRQTAAFGAEDVHALMTATALSADLSALGRFVESERTARAAHESFAALYGSDHPLTLRAANNLALALRAEGDYLGAREIDREAYALRRQVLGEDHSQTILSALNLARDLREAGDFAESTAILRATLERSQRALGPDYPETLRSASSLAISLRKSGQHQEALQVSQTLLQQYELLYAPDSPDTLACRLNLACDLAATGNPVQALEVSDAITAAYERKYGSAHQYTLVSSNNRAIYLRGVGRTKEGLDIAEATLARMRAALGPRHPLALCCALNVASARAEANDLAAAAELEQATLEAFTQVLGSDHPDALFCAGNLAITLRTMGRLRESQLLMDDALARLEVALDPAHPLLDAPRRWRRINRDLEPLPV